MELFFDLVFVALIGQLAEGLREHATFGAILAFLALFASVWWSWVNLTFTVNVQIELTRRSLAGYMLSAMAAVGAIAVAAPDALGDRAWLFALGNAALRGVMLALWVRRSWSASTSSRLRILAYNGVTGALWLTSAFVPAPACFILWAIAIVCEIVLLVANAPGLLRQMGTLNVEHLADRFGTLVIIALGESVLAIVVTTSEHFTPPSALVAALALVVAAGLAWSMFMFGVDALRQGLSRLAAAGDSRGIVQTFAFLPYFLVSGIMLLAGAFAKAVHDPMEPLSPASAVSLGGGVALFYAANAVISIRYGIRRRFVLSWAIPAVLLPAVTIVLALVVPAATSIAVTTIVVLAEVLARRSSR